MSSARRWAAVGVLLVGFTLAVAFAVSVIVALGIGFEIYLGGILFAWLLFAIVLPMATGVISPREMTDNIRARHRPARYFEGEPLPARDDWYAARRGQTSRNKATP